MNPSEMSNLVEDLLAGDRARRETNLRIGCGEINAKFDRLGQWFSGTMVFEIDQKLREELTSRRDWILDSWKRVLQAGVQPGLVDTDLVSDVASFANDALQRELGALMKAAGEIWDSSSPRHELTRPLSEMFDLRGLLFDLARSLRAQLQIAIAGYSRTDLNEDISRRPEIQEDSAGTTLPSDKQVARPMAGIETKSLTAPNEAIVDEIGVRSKMPQVVDFYRMLVASPSDCSTERRVIVEVINDWNAAHTLASSIFLEPVLWESHSLPQLGGRPQMIINQQLVSNCDFLVGVFWTRLGSPTGHAESGTAEEIEEIRNSGRHVLLYFSNTPAPPNSIDPEQYRALHHYREKMKALGLVAEYADMLEFRRIFSRNLNALMAKVAQVGVNYAQTSTNSGGIVAKEVGLSEAVDLLKQHGTFFWHDLSELGPREDHFSSEMRASTYEKVRHALNSLERDGHLELRKTSDRISESGEEILKISASSISSQLRILAKKSRDSS